MPHPISSLVYNLGELALYFSVDIIGCFASLALLISIVDILAENVEFFTDLIRLFSKILA
jgi:hypothetical protein